MSTTDSDVFPLPPSGRSGWPWKAELQPLPATRPGGGPWPKISVVTPSYNQAHYLEETIRSVLLQGYPDVELIIIDGGSTDSSIEVIKKYEPWIAYWVSEKDQGQAHAVNKGFRRATGDWIGWQNSDDFYEPGSFYALVQAAVSHPDVDVFYGDARITNPDGSFNHLACVHKEFSLEKMLPLPYVFNQSAFYNQRVIDQGYYLDPRKQHMMDYDFIWRLVLAGFKFQYTTGVSANFRSQPDAKTYYQTDVGESEFIDIYTYLYHHPRFPRRLRKRVVMGMRQQCLNDWAHYRFVFYRKHVAKMISVMGINTLTLKIATIYVLSLLGPKVLKSLKNSFRIFGDK